MRMFRREILTGLLLAGTACWVMSCASQKRATNIYSAHPWAEAEALFHQDPRWLGSDAALSIPLGNSRTLWLFGDTFVATTSRNVRSESEMVRNTVAIQIGDDPRTASMRFYWRLNADGSPASFFPNHDERWYWPGHGIRLAEGPLVVFLYAMIATPGVGLGFACTGYAIAVVDEPAMPADTWKPRIVEGASSTFDLIPATAVVRDGAYVVALAIRQQGTHAGALVRFPAASLAQGDVSQAEWWAEDGRGWVPEADLGYAGPGFIMDDAGAECSLHWEPRTNSFVHIASDGFGATTIGLRTASALTGPWSSAVLVYRPPESDGPRPFVYAAKAHPELIGPDPADLVVTYATNSFEFADLFTEHGERTLYWPRFVLVRVGK